MPQIKLGCAGCPECKPEDYKKPSAASAGSTGIYVVELAWESGRKESQLVDAKDKHEAILKSMLITFGLSEIDVTAMR